MILSMGLENTSNSMIDSTFQSEDRMMAEIWTAGEMVGKEIDDMQGCGEAIETKY